MRNPKISIKILSITLLLVINLLFTNQAKSQNKDLYIGVQAGTGFTLFSPFDANVTYNGKITLTKNISKHWFGELGLSYNRYAFSYNINSTPNYPNNKHTVSDNYMGISAIGGVQFFKKVKLVIKAGPEVSYLVNSKLIDKNLYTGETTKESYKSSDNYRFGIVAGVGVIVPLSDKFRLTVDVMSNSSISRTGEFGIKLIRPNSLYISAGLQMKF